MPGRTRSFEPGEVIIKVPFPDATKLGRISAAQRRHVTQKLVQVLVGTDAS